MKARRTSIGCYTVAAHGQTVTLRRMGRSGFRVEMRPGALSPVFRRLRDAATLAMASVEPWPFDVEKKPDLALDLPSFLRRTA